MPSVAACGNWRHGPRRTEAGRDGRLPDGGADIPRVSAQRGDPPAVLDGHQLDGVLRGRLAGGRGPDLGGGALPVLRHGDLADRQPGVLDLRKALLHRDLAWEPDLRELAHELGSEDAVAERLVVLRGGRAAELVERLTDLLLGGGAVVAAAGEQSRRERRGGQRAP